MRKRDGACPEHGDNCPYYTPDRTAGTTKPEKPLPRVNDKPWNDPWHDVLGDIQNALGEARMHPRVDPEVIRGIERVTGETHDPETDTWRTDGRTD